MRLSVGQLATGFETFADHLIGCLAVEHALAAGVVGGIEAAQQLVKILVRIEGNAQHLAADTAIEALHHAIGLWRVGLGVAVLRPEFGTDFGKGWGEATAVVGQHMGQMEWEGGGCLAQEGNGALLSFIVLDGQVDGARAAVDGDVERALAAFAIGGLQLG